MSIQPDATLQHWCIEAAEDTREDPGYRCPFTNVTETPTTGTVALSLGDFMALIPRWQYMSDRSKAIVKNTAGTVVVLLIGFVLLRAFLGWIVLAVIIWAGWKYLNRK
jgi:hypothetical protein